jgi:hypothetical protein
MYELSVKGISRKFRGLTGVFSIKHQLLRNVNAPISLRASLVSISTLLVQNTIVDCGTGIDQAYSQFWTHIIVRVKLIPQNVDHLPTPLEQWKAYWKMGIEAIWNRQIPSSFPEGLFLASMGSAQEFWLPIQEETKQESGDSEIQIWA